MSLCVCASLNCPDGDAGPASDAPPQHQLQLPLPLLLFLLAVSLSLSPCETMTQSHNYNYNYNRLSLCHSAILQSCSHSGWSSPSVPPGTRQIPGIPIPKPVAVPFCSLVHWLAVGQSMADGLKCSAGPLRFVLRLAFSIRKLC